MRVWDTFQPHITSVAGVQREYRESTLLCLMAVQMPQLNLQGWALPHEDQQVQYAQKKVSVNIYSTTHSSIFSIRDRYSDLYVGMGVVEMF